MNKFYLESEFLDLNYFISDDTAISYIYEHFSNSIYALIRSNTATEYNSVYKLQIPQLHNKKVDQEIFFITNDINNKKHLAILAEDEVTIVTDVYFDNGLIEVKFNQLGNYQLVVNADTDYCEGNSKKAFQNEDNVYLCSVDLYFDFKVTRDKFGVIEILKENTHYLLLFAFIFISVVGIILFVCYKKFWPMIINFFRPFRYSNEVDETQASDDNKTKRDDKENTNNDQIEIITKKEKSKTKKEVLITSGSI